MCGVRYSCLVMRLQRCGCCLRMMGGGGFQDEVAGDGGVFLETGRVVGEGGGERGCIADEIGTNRQLQYICLALTHVAFDFQCEVQKSFIMTQLLRDVYACVCVLGGVCVVCFLLCGREGCRFSWRDR